MPPNPSSVVLVALGVVLQVAVHVLERLDVQVPVLSDELDNGVVVLPDENGQLLRFHQNLPLSLVQVVGVFAHEDFPLVGWGVGLVVRLRLFLCIGVCVGRLAFGGLGVSVCTVHVIPALIWNPIHLGFVLLVVQTHWIRALRPV